MRNDIVNNNAWCKHIVPTYMWLYVSKRNIKNKNSFFRQLAYTHAVTLLLECPWDHLPSRGTLSDEFSTADCSNPLTWKCEIFMDLMDLVLNSLAKSVSSSILFILSAGILTTAIVQWNDTLYEFTRKLRERSVDAYFFFGEEVDALSKDSRCTLE